MKLSRKPYRFVEHFLPKKSERLIHYEGHIVMENILEQ